MTSLIFTDHIALIVVVVRVCVCALYREMGINSTSRMFVSNASPGLYSAFITGTHGRLATKLGTAAWNPTPLSQWTLVTSGNNFAVWKHTVSAVESMQSDDYYSSAA